MTMTDVTTETPVLDEQGRRADQEYVACVPWGGGKWRCVLVWRSHCRGQLYLHLHTWNRHRTKHVWYPTKRKFTIGVDNVSALSNALVLAAAGQVGEKPRWLQARERGEDFVDYSEGQARVTSTLPASCR